MTRARLASLFLALALLACQSQAFLPSLITRPQASHTLIDRFEYHNGARLFTPELASRKAGH